MTSSDGDLEIATPGSRRWYVVQTQPRKELYAAANLRNQGFPPFVAQIRRTLRHARQMRSVNAPLFPRYVFVALDLTRDRWRSVRGTFGVSSLVMEGDAPLPVPRGVVEQLIASTSATGVVDFRPELAPGQTVQFLTGPFAEKLGRLLTLDAPGRVSVLLEILGSERAVKVSSEDLIPVGG